jgi:hypothetical protein
MLKTDTFAESGNPCGSLAIAPEPSGSDGPAISVRFWRVPVFACDKHFSSPVPSLRPACAVPLYLMMIASPLFVGSPLANDKRRRRGLKLDPVVTPRARPLSSQVKIKAFFTFARKWRTCPPNGGLLAIGSADTPRILSADYSRGSNRPRTVGAWTTAAGPKVAIDRLDRFAFYAYFSDYP